MGRYQVIETTLRGYEGSDQNEFILDISTLKPISKREFYEGLKNHIYNRPSKENKYRGLPNGGKGDTLYSNQNTKYVDTIKHGEVSYDIKRLKGKQRNMKDIETFMRENIGNTVYYYVLLK